MPKVGERYEPEYGVNWYDGNDPDGVPRGYWPRREDGSCDFQIRLRWVDDAPTNPEDASGHFEVMRREAGYGYYHGVSDRPGGGGMTGTIAPGPVASLEAYAEGSAEVAEDDESPWARIRYLFGGEK